MLHIFPANAGVPQTRVPYVISGTTCLLFFTNSPFIKISNVPPSKLRTILFHSWVLKFLLLYKIMFPSVSRLSGYLISSFVTLFGGFTVIISSDLLTPKSNWQNSGLSKRQEPCGRFRCLALRVSIRLSRVMAPRFGAVRRF